MPGVQYPHCRPWVSQNASWITLSSPGADADALDGGDLVAVGLHRQHQAGSNRLAIEQHGAGAADAMLATGMGAVEQEILAQRIEQRLARLDVGGTVDAVDAQIDLHRASPLDMAAALSRACSSARMQSVTATRRR